MSRDARRETVNSLVELFFEVSNALDIDLFVEAGAKEGDASRRADGGGVRRVVAFEANPYTYRRFAERHESSAVEYMHLALGDSQGPVTFFVRVDTDGRPIADGQGSVLVRPDHEPGYEEVEVESVQLNDYFVDDAAEHVAMWIDVEGASASVLRGADELLRRTDVVFIEVENRLTWNGQEWVDIDVIEFLRSFDLVPVGRDLQSRYQFNILFVRATSLRHPQVQRHVDAWHSTI